LLPTEAKLESQAHAAGLVHHSQTESAALRHEADAAGGWERRTERCVKGMAGIGVEDAHAVRTDQPHTAAAADFERFRLTLPALASHLGEARRDHDQCVEALLSTGLGYATHLLGGNDDPGLKGSTQRWPVEPRVGVR